MKWMILLLALKGVVNTGSRVYNEPMLANPILNHCERAQLDQEMAEWCSRSSGIIELPCNIIIINNWWWFVSSDSSLDFGQTDSCPFHFWGITAGLTCRLDICIIHFLKIGRCFNYGFIFLFSKWCIIYPFLLAFYFL